jgi:peroxiredoxin
MTIPLRRHLGPGDPAPNFALPAVNRDGIVALEDYRGKSPLLVGLLRGLHCPFCRRRIVQLGITSDKLGREGVETVAILNTSVERARQYFQYRPTRVLLAADQEVLTHRAFGLPQIKILPDDIAPDGLQWPQTATVAQYRAIRFNPTGELSEPMNPFENEEILNEIDGFKATEFDRKNAVAHGPQLTGHFIIDPSGIIRWAHVDGFDEPNEIGMFPSDEHILVAARALSH